MEKGLYFIIITGLAATSPVLYGADAATANKPAWWLQKYGPTLFQQERVNTVRVGRDTRAYRDQASSRSTATSSPSSVRTSPIQR